MKIHERNGVRTQNIPGAALWPDLSLRGQVSDLSNIDCQHPGTGALSPAVFPSELSPLAASQEEDCDKLIAGHHNTMKYSCELVAAAH